MKKSTRKSLLNKLYNLWREYIYKRDKYKCQLCGKSKRQGYVINAHHIVTKGSSGFAGKYDVENGVVLCFRCHKIDYIALGDFCKKWLKQKGLDYYELQDKYSEVAGYKPTIYDIETKLKILKDLQGDDL